MDLRTLLLILHVLFAAAWFAAPLALPPMLRQTLPHGRAPFLAVASLSTRFGILGAVSNVGTLLTGLGLMFLVYGGFGAPVQFHVALGAVLLASVLGFAVQKPAGEALVRDASAEAWTPEQAAPAVRRLGIGVIAQMVLWFVAMASMFLS